MKGKIPKKMKVAWLLFLSTAVVACITIIIITHKNQSNEEAAPVNKNLPVASSFDNKPSPTPSDTIVTDNEPIKKTVILSDSIEYPSEPDTDITPFVPSISPNDSIYSGNSAQLLTAGSTTVGTLKYKLVKIVGEAETLIRNYDTEIPTATDAGDYRVYYKVFGDKNHKDSAEYSLLVTIQPKPINWDNNHTVLDKRYDGTVNAEVNDLDFEGIVPSDIGEVFMAVGTVAFDSADVGERTAIFSGYALAGDKAFNYVLSGQPTSRTATITAKPYTQSVKNKKAEDIEYTGEPLTANGYEIYDGDIILVESKDYTISGKEKTNVGTYNLTITFKGNYSGSTSLTWEVIPKSLTNLIIENAPSKTYNGLTQTVSGYEIKYGEKILTSADYDLEDTTGLNAGTYTVNVSFKGNYSGASSFNWEITKANLIIKADNKEKIHGDADPEFTVNYNGFVASEDENVLDGTLTFSIQGEYESPATDRPVGNYYIRPSGYGEESINYHITYLDGTLEVTASPAEIDTPPTAKSGLIYNANPAGQSLINAGTASGGTIRYSLDNATWTENANEITGTNAGNYTVYYKVDADGEHTSLGVANITANIAPKNLTDNATITNATDTVYNGEVKIPLGYTIKDGIIPLTKDTDYEFAGIVNSDSEEVAELIDADTYTINVEFINNYTGTGEISFTINKADITTFTHPVAKTGLVYNGTAQELIIEGSTTISGLNMEYKLASYNGIAESHSWSTTVPKGELPGEYEVDYRIPENKNYNRVDGFAPVSVSIAEGTIPTPTPTPTPSPTPPPTPTTYAPPQQVLPTNNALNPWYLKIYDEDNHIIFQDTENGFLMSASEEVENMILRDGTPLAKRLGELLSSLEPTTIVWDGEFIVTTTLKIKKIEFYQLD